MVKRIELIIQKPYRLIKRNTWLTLAWVAQSCSRGRWSMAGVRTTKLAPPFCTARVRFIFFCLCACWLLVVRLLPWLCIIKLHSKMRWTRKDSTSHTWVRKKVSLDARPADFSSCLTGYNENLWLPPCCKGSWERVY